MASADILCGWVEAVRGTPHSGLAQLERGIEGWHATGVSKAEPFWLWLLADVHQRQGELSRARSITDQALNRVLDVGELWWKAEIYRLRGHLMQRDPGLRGDLNSARQ